MTMINRGIQQFYANRAATMDSSIRWTHPAMLAFDSSVVLRAAAELSRFSWIDVGCGSGDLQRSLVNHYAFAVGIDAEAGMAKFWPIGPNSMFIPSSGGDVELAASVDLVTGFGLITCLEIDEELKLLAKARQWSQRAVFKHQVAHSEEIHFSGFSEHLQSNYWARYPSVRGQEERLKDFWDDVEIVRYPAELNQHADTFHAAFICRSMT